MPAFDHNYTSHTPWSDPQDHAHRLLELPAEPERLADGCAKLILHFAVAPMRGIEVPLAARSDVGVRTVEAMLARILDRDAGSLDIVRKPQDHFFGSCRDFALLAAARLRQAGIPARLRVGFANYFTPGFLVDHWVCEYDNGAGWKLLDPELDAATRQQFGVGFPAHDVPRDRFLSAAIVWQGIRASHIDPAKVGVPEIAVGAWFAAGSLLRQAAALTRWELEPWDYWGAAREFRPDAPIPERWLPELDALAAALASEPATLTDARRIVEPHPWAVVTPTVLSFPYGAPIEDAILPA